MQKKRTTTPSSSLLRSIITGAMGLHAADVQAASSGTPHVGTLTDRDDASVSLVEAASTAPAPSYLEFGIYYMTSGETEHLQVLQAQELIMDDSSQLYLDGVLEVSTIRIDDYVQLAGVSSPLIHAADMVSVQDNVFTFDFSSVSIENMALNTLTPCLIVELSEEAYFTSWEKSFVFQIDGVGTDHSQQIGGVTYYLNPLGKDVYIYAIPGELIPSDRLDPIEEEMIPEPGSATLSLVALASLLSRRRRRSQRG